MEEKRDISSESHIDLVSGSNFLDGRENSAERSHALFLKERMEGLARPLSISENNFLTIINDYLDGKIETFLEPDGGKGSINILNLPQELLRRLYAIEVFSMEHLASLDTEEICEAEITRNALEESKDRGKLN